LQFANNNFYKGFSVLCDKPGNPIYEKKGIDIYRLQGERVNRWTGVQFTRYEVRFTNEISKYKLRILNCLKINL